MFLNAVPKERLSFFFQTVGAVSKVFSAFPTLRMVGEMMICTALGTLAASAISYPGQSQRHRQFQRIYPFEYHPTVKKFSHPFGHA